MSNRYAVITCAVLEAEVRHFQTINPGICHIDVLEQGLHNEPNKLRSELQGRIDAIEGSMNVDAILLGYGLCSRGTEGVYAQRSQLVMARAHDCITLLLGDKQRYAQYVKDNPGTYWYSPGWNRHHIPPGKQRYENLRQKYVEQFGADNADFLMESEQTWFKTYNRATYVDLGVDVTEADLQYTRDCAHWLGWEMDHQHGDPELLCALLEGRWDPDRFIVLEPGQSFRMTADERIIEPDQKSSALHLPILEATKT